MEPLGLKLLLLCLTAICPTQPWGWPGWGEALEDDPLEPAMFLNNAVGEKRIKAFISTFKPSEYSGDIDNARFLELFLLAEPRGLVMNEHVGDVRSGIRNGERELVLSG